MLRLTDLRPDKNIDRKAWNKSWEDDLKQYEVWERFDLPYIALPPEFTQHTETVLAETRLVLERHTKDICSLQEDIRGFALSQDGLEEKWKGLSDLQREDLILAAIVVTCCIGPDMEDFRKWCPEITLATMGKTKGQGFIDLLTIIVTHDLGKPITKPISFKNKALERNWGHPLLQSQRESINSNRCYFISLFIWRTLLALFGKNEEVIIAKPPRHSGLPKKSLRGISEKTFGREESRKIQQDVRAYKKLVAGYASICWHCGKGGVELRACSKCKTIGRNVPYCSKECQKSDWKSGVPRPHKSICGKPFTKDSDNAMVPEVASNSPEKIPPPESTFKRSFPLLSQINMLVESKMNSDYMLVQLPPLPDIGVVIPGWKARVMFLVMRSRAMKNGDKNAVETMFYLLLPIAQQLGIDEKQLARQLEKEYNIAVAVSKGYGEHDPLEPTEEEIDWAADLILSFDQNGKGAG